jgi:hypothetical protein
VKPVAAAAAAAAATAAAPAPISKAMLVATEAAEATAWTGASWSSWANGSFSHTAVPHAGAWQLLCYWLACLPALVFSLLTLLHLSAVVI